MGKEFKIASNPGFSELERFTKYADPSRTSIEATGGRLIVRSPSPHAYEDGYSERVIIIEFASVEKARAA